MIELKGKYETAVCFTDYVEPSAISQIINLCNQEFVGGTHPRIMPDVHAGAGCTIGTTMIIKDKVVPGHVGVDIGCGMEVYQIDQKSVDFTKLDKVVHGVPSGAAIWADEQPVNAKLDELRARNANLSKARCSKGSLGGGNHYIELDRDEQGNFFLVIHTGSRHLGMEIALYYQKQAAVFYREEKTKEFIKVLKSQGRAKEIEAELKHFKVQLEKEIEAYQEQMFVSGVLLDDYIHDALIVQAFASENRQRIAQIVVEGMGWAVVNHFD